MSSVIAADACPSIRCTSRFAPELIARGAAIRFNGDREGDRNCRNKPARGAHAREPAGRLLPPPDAESASDRSRLRSRRSTWKCALARGASQLFRRRALRPIQSLDDHKSWVARPSDPKLAVLSRRAIVLATGRAFPMGALSTLTRACAGRMPDAALLTWTAWTLRLRSG